MTEYRLTCYYCENDCKLDRLSSCDNATYCWKGTFRAPDGSNRRLRGCFNDVEQVRIYCDSRPQKDTSRFRTECCTTHFCNNGTFPSLGNSKQLPRTTLSPTVINLVIFGPMVFGILLVLSCWLYHWILKKDRITDEKYHVAYRLADESDFGAIDTAGQRDNQVWTIPPNASDPSGLPLQERITITLCMEDDAFGPYELWRGTTNRNKNVMVKIYPPASEMLWIHEIEVYTELLPMKHKNILGYIENGMVGLELNKRLWIILDGHTNGSLISYLKVTRLNQNEMLNAISSLIRGLTYLHSVPMAHRNLSSKTVFVNEDGECVIGGLEYAVTQDQFDRVNFPSRASKRYMSPELLEPTFAEEGIWNLETFQKADIYSLALILWEICYMYVEKDDVVLNYTAPFSEWLTESELEPTTTNMRALVLADERRPTNPDHWDELPIMKKLKPIIEKCWDKISENRPLITEVMKTVEGFLMN